MAVYELLVVRESKSNWFRFQTRQALWFGIVAGLVEFAALLWPLLLSALFPNVMAIEIVYGLALVVDVVVFAVVLTLAIRYSRRAARGEMFEIPLVTNLTRRVGVKR